jgi:hypothetical protein
MNPQALHNLDPEPVNVLLFRHTGGLTILGTLQPCSYLLHTKLFLQFYVIVPHLIEVSA